jgi:hypothetical protein
VAASDQRLRLWCPTVGSCRWEVSDRGRIRSDQLSAYENKTPAPAQVAETAELAKGRLRPKIPALREALITGSASSTTGR